jgi:hypothetical protein
MMFDLIRRRRKRRKPVDPATRIGREVGKVAGAAASGVILGLLRKFLKK